MKISRILLVAVAAIILVLMAPFKKTDDLPELSEVTSADELKGYTYDQLVSVYGEPSDVAGTNTDVWWDEESGMSVQVTFDPFGKSLEIVIGEAQQ